MNACILVPHIIFPPHTGGKIMRRKATQQRLFPALPRFWIPITPCEYITMHMETHMHMNTCMRKYAHKNMIIHKEALAFCFPTAGSPTVQLRHWGMGSSQGRGKAAGLVLQCDHDSTCCTLQGKGLRGDKLGMEGAEHRGWDRAGPAGLVYPNKNSTPCPFLKGPSFAHWVCQYILLKRWPCLNPKPSWGSNAWWTWPVHWPQSERELPQALGGWKSFLSSIWR